MSVEDRVQKIVCEQLGVSSEEVKLEETPVVKKETTLSKDELLANFDWDKAAQNDMYTNEERTGLEKEYVSTLPEVMDKQVIDGTVVMITDREVVVDINFKSDGVLSFNEFKYNEDLKVGDFVEQSNLIGLVGSTGRVTGPHLHWTVYFDGNKVNPESLVKESYLSTLLKIAINKT